MVFEIDIDDEGCWSETLGTIRRFSRRSFFSENKARGWLEEQSLRGAFDRGAQTGSKLLIAAAAMVGLAS